ncbi:MAG TPA: class I adenylate-forming enzyme family protein, partial [Leptospiraceae bacterium]|nr:class I adenylate-forming enzyme family protein [Leptospiraceae bacterium]
MEIENFNLTKYCFSKNLENNPEKKALIFIHENGKREEKKFAELYNEILSLANHLGKFQLPPFSRVLIRLENNLHYAKLFFASIAQGLVPIPLSPRLTGKEVDFIASDSKASLLIYSKNLEVSKELLQNIQSIPEELLKYEDNENIPQFLFKTQKEDPAFLIYTSGTTGKPKGVLHAHRNIVGRIPMIEGWSGISHNDILLHAGQLNWTYTLGVGLMDTWTRGGTSILYNGSSHPELWLELIEKEKATIFVAVPSLFRRILKHVDIKKYNLESLRYALTAGEALSIPIYKKWKEQTGKELYEALGMSEISTYISSGPSVPIQLGSPGKAQAGRRVVILPIEGGIEPLKNGEIGLIAVHRSDPGLMLRYWNRPEEESQVYRGDWFIGGDLAHIDKEGYIFFHGRNNEIMNSFGYRVSPLEVESVI